MENINRQEELLGYLKGVHFASVSELAGVLYTSEATVRRDIAKLEAKGALKAVYGGVVITEYESESKPIYLRDRENSSLKEQIAEKAAKMIKDNTTVFLDSSSTVRRMCKYIRSRKNLTVVTNNLRILNELAASEVKLVCTGGTLVRGDDCFVGHIVEDFLRKMRFDAVFFSSRGISDSGDITDSDEQELSARLAALQQARAKYFLADSSKCGNEYPYVLCNLKDITGSFIL